MKIGTAEVLSGFFLAALSAGIPGYDGGGLGAQDQAEGIHAVRLYFSALDRQHSPVLGLTADDFRLRINGTPAVLEGFRPGRASEQSTIPVVAWVLLDFNPRISAAVIANQAEAAASALDLMHQDSVLGVRLVSDRSEELAPLSHDADLVRKAFQSFRTRRSEVRIYRENGSALLGPGGLVRAAELAVGEIRDYAAGRPELRGRETYGAVLMVSDANVNPSYNRSRLIEAAARAGVFLYPVFMPRSSFGHWVSDYLDLGRRSGGLGLVFGAIRPGTDLFRLPRENLDPNALMFGFLNMVRDLNGKYSFQVALPGETTQLKLDLRCMREGVNVLLPRREIP